MFFLKRPYRPPSPHRALFFTIIPDIKNIYFVHTHTVLLLHIHAGKTKVRKHQRASVAEQFGELVGKSEEGKDYEVMEGVEEEDAVPGVPGLEGYSAADRLLEPVSLCGRVSGSGFPCGGWKHLG